MTRASSDPAAALASLVTLRDWLRYAVSRFGQAKLSYGHGTAGALDEAAFLILHTLHLAHDEDLAPWLAARLTEPERRAVSDIIEARIATRKPAAYLTNVAYIQGRAFYVDERVIVPRSFIGELLGDGLAALIDNPDAITSVLDLCTGSGCLAILAAEAFPNAKIVAADLTPDALAVAARNVGDYDLAGRIDLVQSNLFDALGTRRFDLILSNPPYVTAQAIAAFPPEYRAEPVLAHLGGGDGMDLVRRILADAPAHLTPAATLVVEIGQGRPVLEAAYPALPFLWLETEASAGEVFALRAADLAPAKKARKR